jgi:type I restriction enzyme S subunit
MSENQEIPREWVLARLGDICETTSGGTPSRKESKYYGGSIPWVKSGELKHNIIIDTEEKITEEAIKNSSTKIFPKGTLLIALYGATIGKLAFLGVAAATNQAVCGIYGNEYINLKFMFNYLHFKRQDLVHESIGGAQPNISQTILKNLEIPVPPLPEQQRIVAKIEELFSSLDKGIENLKTAQQQLKVYRQAVLKWAFEGRLTKSTLRQAQGTVMPMAVVTEPAEAIEATDKNDQLPKGDALSLPKGWKVETLGDISEMCLGKMLDKSKNKGSYKPYLRNISVRWGYFDLSNLEEMRFEEDEEERYSLKKGDLIICEGGEPGRCAIWNDAVPNMKIQKALHRVRVKNIVSEKYLFYFMFYSGTCGLLEKYFTGTTIKHLTGRELKKIEIPLPPLPEQHAIVAEIESRLSVCDKIEESIEQSLKQSESLRQSILKKAFEGKLVPQDPNDEPASKLLERIKAEKETLKKKK